MVERKKGCPEEYPVRLIVNDIQLAIFQLTKGDLTDWAYGYLFSERLIHKKEDLQQLWISEDQSVIKVRISGDIERLLAFKEKHHTAGCGNGITFFSMTDISKFQKVECSLKTTQTKLMEKMRKFYDLSPLYLETGGMHGACVLLPNHSLEIREDIGRHNAVDKIIGHCLQSDYNPKQLILLTTGRVSYEMLSKVANYGIGIIAPRTAATLQAVQLAKVLDVEVVGYLRGKMGIVYTELGRVETS